MGRYLDSAEVERLAEVTRLSLTVRRLDDAQMPSDFHVALSSLLEQGSTFVKPLGRESVAGYVEVNDIYGEPALLLRIDVPREIYKQGMSSIRYYLASLLAVWLAFSVLTWQLLRRLVIDQLTRLSKDVDTIRTSGDLSMRVSSARTYELSSLADVINEMLKKLQDSQHELREREEALRHRNRELELLNLAAQTLGATLDLSNILITFLEVVRSLMGTVASSIWLKDPEANELVCVQATGLQSESVSGWRLKLGEGIAGWVARTGETINVPDAKADERHFEGIDRQTGVKLHSVLCVPLKTRQDVIGVLEVVDTKVARFQPADQRLLESLAASAAVAIDNARLFDAVRANEADLRDLSTRLIEVQEQERRHIAQELHDELGQLLTAIKINVDLARRKLPDEANSLGRRLEEVSNLTDDVLSNVRSMTIELRPTLLDDMGIVPALRWYLKRFARHTGVQVELQAPEQAVRLAPEIETAIYRVTQEALTNVARHAQASQVQVWLAYAGDTVIASIQDDGQGFDAEERIKQQGERQTLGLTGIRERVMLLGGRVAIDSEQGKGTQIEIELPLRFRAENRE
jgi:signal transduction histidine kinase